MTKTYRTRQGETVDLACWRHYGRTREVVERVLAANPDISRMPLALPPGTAIAMPAVPARAQARRLVRLWD